MTETTFISLLLAVACCGGCVLAEAPATHGTDQLQALVKQLGSKDFDEREDAQLKLAGMGEAAREILTKALECADPEISSAATDLLEKINRAVVAVRVVDSTEKPLAKVPVIFNLDLHDGRRLVSVLHNETVSTDADGWACVGDLKPGAGYILNAGYRMPNHVPAVISQQSMELKVKRHEFKLVARRCTTVSGTLLDQAEVPLVDGRLALVPSNRYCLLANPKLAYFASRNAPIATTDKHGQFKFELVNPGEYALVLVNDERLLWKSDTIRVEAEDTLALGVLRTKVDPAMLNRDDDILQGNGEDPAPEK